MIFPGGTAVFREPQSQPPFPGPADQFVTGLTADAAELRDPPGRDVDQLAHGGDAKALLRDRQGAGGKPGRSERRAGHDLLAPPAARCGVSVGGVFQADRGRGGERRDRLQVAEDVGPGQVISRSEPNRLAASRCRARRKNSTRPSRATGSKRSSASCDFLGRVEEAGLVQVVAPGRQLAAGHLVQGDRDRVQLGGLVVAVPAAGAEERVEVVVGAGVSSVSGVPAREKSNRTSSRPLRSSARRARLSGLMSRCQTPRLSRNLIAWNRSSPRRSSSWMVSAAVLAQLVGQGVVADVLDADDGAPASVGPAWKGGSSRRATCESVSWPSCGASRSEAAAGGVVERDLEDALAAPPSVDQQRPWRWSPCRAPARPSSRRSRRPCPRSAGPARGSRSGRGELSSILSRSLEEVADGLGAVGRMRARWRSRTRSSIERADRVDDRGRDERALWVRRWPSSLAGRGGRLAGEDQVAERAEAEDVEQRGSASGLPNSGAR